MGLVVLNVGWMEKYCGQSETDQVVYKGIQSLSKLSGYEQNNFLEQGGMVYGFVEPPGSGIVKGPVGTDKQLDIARDRKSVV